jgi:hypothetical protein
VTPERPKPRSISLWVGGVGLAAIAIWMGIWLVFDSGQSRLYYQYRHQDQLPEYPIREVVQWLGAIAGELGLACALLLGARKTHPAVRLLANAAWMGLLCFCNAALLMHAPPYFADHAVWLLFAAAWSIVIAIAAAIESRVRA